VIQPPKRITISFDGHDEESHDAIRGQGSFSKTVRNTYLLGATKIPLQIQATMIRPILNTLDDMLELTKVLGANRLMLAWPIPTPELFERKWFPDYEELAEAKHWYQELSKNDQSRIVFALGDQLLAKSSRDVKPCPFMRGEQFYVNSRGRQALCCQMAGVGTNSSEEVGNIHEGLKEFSSEQSVAPLSAERPMDRFGCMGCMANLKKLPSRLLFPEMRQWVQPVAKNAQLSILPRTSHDSLT
jgi:MoaA/NifB/PqqE/SkfB family radical SAM enzyme